MKWNTEDHEEDEEPSEERCWICGFPMNEWDTKCKQCEKRKEEECIVRNVTTEECDK